MKRAILAAAAFAFASAANAATVTECIADAQIIDNDILAATTFVNAKDQVQLAGKVDSVISKLDKAKFADALSDLDAMSKKVASLLEASKPKLGAADAALISADIATAQTCITQLMTQ
jgi:hypothetical protein